MKEIHGTLSFVVGGDIVVFANAVSRSLSKKTDTDINIHICIHICMCDEEIQTPLINMFFNLIFFWANANASYGMLCMHSVISKL